MVLGKQHIVRDLLLSVFVCIGSNQEVQAQHWSNAYGCGNCHVHDCYYDASCSAGRACGSGCCWKVQAEGLFWTTHQSNLDYATDHFDGANPIGPGEQHFLEYDWDPGFRVSLIGTPCCDDCWEFKGVYTHFRSEATDVATAPTGGNLRATMVHPASSAQDAATAEGRNQLRYDVLDLLFQTTYSCNSCLSLTPFAGVRVLRLDQELDVEYRGEDFATDGPGSVRWQSDLKGVGLHGGLDFEVDMCGCLSAYGGFGGSLVTMRNKTKHIDVYPGDTGNSPTHVDIRESEHIVIPGADIAIGVKYRCDAFCGCCVESWLGYEFHQWLNTPQLRRYVDSTDHGVSRNPNDGNIAFHGATAGVQFSF